MFDRLKRLYEQGKITEAGLQNAAKGWITQEEYEYIIGAQGSFLFGGNYENSIRQRNNNNSR